MPTPSKEHAAKLPDEADVRFYLLFRQQAVAEDNLVNHRMTWLLLMQGFLLAILAGALSQESLLGRSRFSVLVLLLSSAGIIGSLLILVGIWAAEEAIRRLKREYEEPYRDCGIPRHLPPLTGGEIPHFLGIIPLYLPFLCMLVWIGIAVVLH